MHTVDMPAPQAGQSVTLPLVQHRGAACVPTVKAGDVVGVGQVIGDSEQMMSAPIHSSVSGRVKGTTSLRMPDGREVPAVVVESDGEGRLYEGIAPPQVRTREEFIQAVRASGLVGLGGGGFPTHVKLAVTPGTIDTLLINAAECEPYITADYRACMEHPEDVLRGVRLVMDALNIPLAVVGIERTNPAAIALLRDRAAGFRAGRREIQVKVLPARYPQGAEKVLVYNCIGRRVPTGGLPSDVGCLVMNVSTVAFLYQYMKTGMPLIRKRLTVDGTAVKEPMNVCAPIGTSIGDLLRFCGVLEGDANKVLVGGPMMGWTLMDTGLPIMKPYNAVTAMAGEKTVPCAATACIRCGRCVAACPLTLEPVTLMHAYEREDKEALQRLGINTCMDCGCCAYVCPAQIPLVQGLRLGKIMAAE